MSSLVLMAALSVGANAPAQVYYSYYPYPYCAYGWYPAWPCACWPCGPVIIVRQSAAARKEVDTKADKKDDKRQENRKDEGKKDVDKKNQNDKKLELGNQALLLVELPTDARLFVDGKQMKSGQPQAAIITPALDPGRIYAYEVRVELVRNGQTLTETQRVVLRPGQRSHACFTELAARAEAVATQR